MPNNKKVATARAASRNHAPQPKGSNYFDIVRSLSTDPELQKAVDTVERRVNGSKKR